MIGFLFNGVPLRRNARSKVLWISLLGVAVVTAACGGGVSEDSDSTIVSPDGMATLVIPEGPGRVDRDRERRAWCSIRGSDVDTFRVESVRTGNTPS